MERINKRIRAFRKLRGLTQVELAKKAGVFISVLGKVERGTKKPDLILLEKLSNALDVDIDELTAGQRK